jgi:hypothetical protein
MQQLSPGDHEAKLCDICDFLVENPKLQTACRYAGWSGKYIWTHLRRSSEGDPKYLIRWPDRESERRIQFADAVMQARKMWCATYDGVLRADVSIGQPRPQVWQGEQVWEKDSALLTEWGGDTLQAKQAAENLGGVVDYPYKHRVGRSGKLERVPLVIYERAPASLRQHVARSMMPSQYNPPENRQTSTEHTGTVLVVGASLPPYAKNYQAPMEAGTPLQRDLRARLAELRAKGPKHPIPLDENGRKTIVSVQTVPIRPDDPPDRIGRGELPRVDADGVVTRANAPPMISRKGVPPPGGYSMTTGKMT